MNLIGHDRQIGYLNSCRSRGTLPHAYLFHGPEHVGKLTVALMLAQSFFCALAQKDDIRSVCGECVSCRAISEYRHPAVIMLDTTHTLVSKKEIRKELPIEDIRELKRVLSFAPAGGEWRLAIINEADRMSEEAANAFLKLLEEPGANTLLILVAPHKDLLLPTILSRTQTVGFLTVSDEVLQETLRKEKTPSEEHEELLAFAGGRPGILLQLRKDPELLAEQQKRFREIRGALKKRDMVALLRVSEQISGDAALRETAVSCVIGNLRSELKNGSDSANAGNIIKKIKRIDRIAGLIDSTNINPRLACDVMFLESMA